VFLRSSTLIEKSEERSDILKLIEMTSDKDEECFKAFFQNFYIYGDNELKKKL